MQWNCSVAEAVPLTKPDLIRGPLARLSSRWSFGDWSETRILFGNDKQKQDGMTNKANYA
jgi:hypothetical protein